MKHKSNTANTTNLINTTNINSTTKTSNKNSLESNSNNFLCICKRGRNAFYQCEKTDRYYLEINNTFYPFRVCEFIVFRKKMKDLDIKPFFNSNSPDYHLLNLSHCGSYFLLSINEIIQIKKLTEEAIKILRANSLFRSVTNEVF